MTKLALDCRNLAGYFYKWWQGKIWEAENHPKADGREAAYREMRGFQNAYLTARQWLYEHTDIPEKNIHALIEKKPGGTSIRISPARRALEALDEKGENLKLLAFMWEHFPKECEEIELPRVVQQKKRMDGYLADQKPGSKEPLAKKKRKRTSQEARNQWIYEQCLKGVAYQTIAIRLNKKPASWDRIDSVQGIRTVAIRHARRNGLPEIPRRQEP